MQYLGDITSGTTIRGSFNTRTAAGTPITLGGTPVLSVYKDAGTTETTTGVTLTVDFDSRTGHHVFAVVTTDGFYSTGSDYRVVITTGTVDGTSVVGTEVGSFSIQNRTVGTGLDAAGVRSAIGLASANLDTQLADLPTVSEFNARSLPSDDYFVVGDYTAPANGDISGGSGLDAAGIRAAIGLATANLDTQLADLPTVSEFNARSLPSADYFVVGDYTAPPSAAAIVDSVMDDELESGFSVARTLRIIAASTAGKVTGGPDGPVFRNLSDTANQITGVATEDGNRTTATYGT